jgi:hypothetical protein
VRWCFFTIAGCIASMIRIHSFFIIAVELQNGKISQIKLLAFVKVRVYKNLGMAIFGPANKN